MPQLFAKSKTNACRAIWWPKLELMQVKIEKEKVEETLPEAQRTQGIKSKTWIISAAEMSTNSI